MPASDRLISLDEDGASRKRLYVRNERITPKWVLMAALFWVLVLAIAATMVWSFVKWVRPTPHEHHVKELQERFGCLECAAEPVSEMAQGHRNGSVHSFCKQDTVQEKFNRDEQTMFRRTRKLHGWTTEMDATCHVDLTTEQQVRQMMCAPPTSQEVSALLMIPSRTLEHFDLLDVSLDLCVADLVKDFRASWIQSPVQASCDQHHKELCPGNKDEHKSYMYSNIIKRWTERLQKLGQSNIVQLMGTIMQPDRVKFLMRQDAHMIFTSPCMPRQTDHDSRMIWRHFQDQWMLALRQLAESTNQHFVCASGFFRFCRICLLHPPNQDPLLLLDPRPEIIKSNRFMQHQVHTGMGTVSKQMCFPEIVSMAIHYQRPSDGRADSVFLEVHSAQVNLDHILFILSTMSGHACLHLHHLKTFHEIVHGSRILHDEL